MLLIMDLIVTLVIFGLNTAASRGHTAPYYEMGVMSQPGAHSASSSTFFAESVLDKAHERPSIDQYGDMSLFCLWL